VKTLTAEEVQRAVRGVFLARPETAPSVTSVVIDSRQAGPGAVFFALRGEHVDGHDFVADAFARGAAAAVLQRKPERVPAGSVLIGVKDTVTALGDLARYYRGLFSTTVVAITGSNGKTTTKEMVAHLMAPDGPVVKAPRSYNNFVGVPVTVFAIEATTELVVLELGTSAPGEVHRLATIAQPRIGVITNIGLTHLEGLGSLEGVAGAKAELLDLLGEAGTAVLNWDDDWCRRIERRAPGKVVTFGLTPEADVFATEVVQEDRRIRFKLNGVQDFVLPAVGIHNLSNALAAVAVCRRLGLAPADVAARFAGFRLPAMRFEEVVLDDVTIINDAYNANPMSMSAALTEFARREVEGRKFFVCGDMKELGPESSRFHREVGLRVASHVLDGVFAVGEFADEVAAGAMDGGFPAEAVYTFADVEGLSQALAGELQPGDVVLLKGSRAMGLERVVDALRELLRSKKAR